jgi:amino acid adenylation domain-containing protein
MSKKNIEDIYPLSPMQQGMLFHALSAPESGIYVEHLICTLCGELHVPGFERAWQEVVTRHAILRTLFIWEGIDKPLQVVRRSVNLSIEQHDWRSLSKLEQEERLEALLDEDKRRGFNLSEAPLMRLSLMRVADDSHKFFWSHHHLILDGWSLPLVLREVFDLYKAFRHGRNLQLKPGGTYREYISWLKQQDSSAAQRFWHNYLAGFRAPTPLPTGRLASQPHHSPGESLEQELRLTVRETRRLQAFVREQQLTVSTLVQGAWVIWLSRASGEEEVVYGATVSGRGAGVAGVEEIVGLLINTVAVRVRVEGESSVVGWLRRIQERAAEAVEYEHTPLWQVQQWSDVPRGVPLFESLIVFENYPIDASLFEQNDGLRMTDVRSAEQTNYPLTVSAVILDSQLRLQISYDQSRFDAGTIKRILGHLHTLLLDVVESPRAPLKRLSLLRETERQQLLVKWNGTRTDYPGEKSVHQLFEEQVERRPGAVAVVCGEEELSYEELNRRANRVAHRLGRIGVSPESRVGIMLERSVEMITGLLAILKAGGAYVSLDPQYPRERLDFILAETSVKAVLTDERGLGSLPEEYRDRALRIDKETETIAGQDEHNPAVQMSSDSLAYITYTSGSTGKPKGVSVVHRGVVRLVRQTDYASFGSSETFLQHAPLAFDASTFEIWGSLLNGARLVLMPARQPSLEELAQAIRQHHVTTLWLTAGLFHLMVDHQLEALRPIHQLLAGGDVLSASHVEKFLDKSGDAKLINGYGPTENTTFTCCYAMTGPQGFVSSVPIGRPVSNTEVYILDQHWQPVGIGVTGELYTGGDGLARGYFNSPELTAERFIPHPFSTEPGKRLYQSGDRVRYLPDGNIEFIGRADRQVKVRGFRVEPGEIETVLCQYPSVRESVVVVVREATPGDQRLIAYLVARPEQLIDDNELRDYLKERLPEYMLPSVFVLLDEMPLTLQGKVDRNALPAPDQQRRELKELSAMPRDAIEAALAEIWAQVLGLERVGINDNFFELGGHSLLATQVISRLHKVLQVELPIRAIFETPTVADLSIKIKDARRDGPARPLVPIKRVTREDHLPLSFAQQRLWFLDRLEPDSDFYNIPIAVRLTGHLNVATLQESFNEIVRRHETLRTHFKIFGGEPEQIIAPAQRLELTLTDLSQLSTAEREDRINSLTTEEARRPFKLSTGPLFRVFLLRAGLNEHILLLTMHHIISDGWSMSIFTQEMATLYEAFVRGQPSPLPELAIQYADYAVWQHTLFKGGALQDQLAYWKQHLADGPGILELPTDRPRPKMQTFRGASRSVMLSGELTNALKELSRREGATLFMLLLAAFKVLLHRYSGQSDIAVGTPVANRTHPEIEGLIGFFVNTLVLRTPVSSEESFEELLKRVREVSLEAYAHQELPFEKLVEELQPARDLSRTPFFQVMFAFQNRRLSSRALPGLSVSTLEVSSETSKFDLSLLMEETEQGLGASLEYNTDLFDEPTIARTLVHFETLLQGIVTDPAQPLSCLARSLPDGSSRVDERVRPAIVPTTVDRAKTFIAPRNPLEEQIAKIWSDVLGIEQVGVADNFFDLGGHSLSATRLLAFAQETFKVELPLRLFFESATVEGMARAMIAHEERPGQTEKIAGLLKRLAAMSAEEVGRALKR